MNMRGSEGLLRRLARMVGSRHILIRIVLLVLVLQVTGLCTLARHNQYLPKSDPASFLSDATKMKVGQSPTLCLPTHTHQVAQLVPPQPEGQVTALARPEKHALRQTGLTISLLHRPPPSFLG